MAVSRFDARKQLVVEEANAIDTAALRGRMLPSPFRREVTLLFQNYVETRLAASCLSLNAPELRDLDDRTDGLQEQLWTQAMQVAARDKGQMPAGLFIEALNTVIDITEKR